MQKRKTGQPHRGWKSSVRKSHERGIELILDDQLTDAVMSGRTTPKTDEWWRRLPYSGDKATEWHDRQQKRWRGSRRD